MVFATQTARILRERLGRCFAHRPNRELPMPCLVTSEYGIVVRRAALAERGLSWENLLAALQVSQPHDYDDHLISFGPHFGEETLDALMHRLDGLGLKYL